MRIFIFFLFVTCLFSQYRNNYKYTSNWAFGLGITTQNVVFNDLARENLKVGPDDLVIGGGYRFTQSGLDIRSTYYFDEGRFRIPIGLQSMFYKVREPITGENTILRYTNQANLFGFYTGLHYRLRRIYFINGDVYCGVEWQSTYVQNAKYIYDDINTADQDLSVTTIRYNKHNDRFKHGMNFRLGFDSELEKQVMVNFSIAYQILNLVGRDDSLGPLLVPSIQRFNKEELFQAFSLSLLVQYRL